MEERRRSTSKSKKISGPLLKKGTDQLEAEVKVIQGWISDLSETSDDNPEALAARKTYNAMMQSRQDLLQTLTNK